VAVEENKMSARLDKITKEINRAQTIPLSQKRTMKEVARLQDEALELASQVTNNNIGDNQLLSGGAAWISGLQFEVSPCTYAINGVVYSSQSTTLTLADADGTNPRIDVIVVNTNGVATIVEGTPAANPAKPDIDPETEVEVTFALVAALATTPSGITNTSIYLEDTEWTSVEVGNVASDATADPYAGTKHIMFTAADNGDRIVLTDAGGHDPAAYDRLFFRIKNTQYGTNNRNRLRLVLYSGTTRVSSWINLYHGSYGFNGDDTSGYQFVQIPIGNFIPTGASFDTLRIQVAAATGQTITCAIDNIKLQEGTPSTDTSDFAVLSRHNSYSKAQGSGINALTDAATISWDMGPGNVYSIVLDGNRTMAAPTNVKPGYTYILFVQQDDTTGSRTITWNAVFKWAGGTAPTLSTAVDSVDVITFVADASGNLHGSVGIADSQ
jgi:hypothetical protein